MPTTYQIDPAHSNAHFAIRHMMVTNVRGSFSKVTGTVVYDEANPSATSINASIDATTLNTNDPNRDAHVKSPEFLDVAQYPAITFVSKKVDTSGDEWKVTGDLTIHGVTKEVVLNVEPLGAEGKDPWGGIRTGTTATTKISRSDFGVTYNAALETGGIMLGDELKITLDIEMTKAA